MRVSIKCEDTGEEFNNYYSYLESRHWKTKKEEFLNSKYYNGKCCRCKQKKKFMNIHHLHYDSVGNESLTDLVAICVACHATEHDIEFKTTKISQSKWKW